MGPMISRIDHVSIAVRDYEKAETFFRTILGAIPGASAEDPATKYFWQVFSVGDLSRLELIRSTGQGSFLENFLAQRDGGVHHVTLQTPDIAAAKKTLEQNGIPYFGYNEYQGSYWKEMFIHPRNAFGVLIQIAEFNAEDWLSPSVRLPQERRWKVERGQRGVSLSISHPGGGQARIELSPQEAKRLSRELEKEVA